MPKFRRSRRKKKKVARCGFELRTFGTIIAALPLILVLFIELILISYKPFSFYSGLLPYIVVSFSAYSLANIQTIVSGQDFILKVGATTHRLVVDEAEVSCASVGVSTTTKMHPDEQHMTHDTYTDPYLSLHHTHTQTDTHPHTHVYIVLIYVLSNLHSSIK